MIRLRPYKRCDSKIIVKWIQDKEVFTKWGGAIRCDLGYMQELTNGSWRKLQ